MRPFALFSLSFQILALRAVTAYNFPYEAEQLTEADLFSHNELRFGDHKQVKTDSTCKTYPGDATWPSESTWEAFNTSLGGALIKPVSKALACFAGDAYNQTLCAGIVDAVKNSIYHETDPVSGMLSWPSGNGCVPSLNTTGTCSMLGFPVYVVNATTVKQIQMAVNFARNNNIRLVIKNSGHDYLGRSIGAGALSIWVHNIKQFEFLPSYTIGQYSGMAAKLSAGLQSYDLGYYTSLYNVTIIQPGGNTVGALGGFIQGAGHSSYTSYWGMAADQVLSIQLVTADGRFITASPLENQDLFHAVRGGGGGNWGIITSAIVKALPPVGIASSSLFFTNFNITNATFWGAFNAYHKHVPRIVDAGAIGYNFVRNGPKGFLSFQNSITMPGMTAQQLENFTQAMTADIVAAGLKIPNPRANYRPGGLRLGNSTFVLRKFGDGVTNTMMATRLLPRSNFDDATLFSRTMAAIRAFVEAGYTYHGINYAPTENLAGWPGNSSVNPHFRRTVTHAEAWAVKAGDGPMGQVKEEYDRFNSFVQPWRELTPTAGSYMNEADANEPNFQWSFYGENYPRLMRIKQNTDPWGLFYSNAGVGSEYWEVRGSTPGMKTQDGRLCRLANPSSNWKMPAGFSSGTESTSGVGSKRSVRESNIEVVAKLPYRKRPVRTGTSS